MTGHDTAWPLIAAMISISKPRSLLASHGFIIENLSQRIDLGKLARGQDELTYEPEQFPAAICRLAELPEITILLFSPGKAVIAGVGDPDHLDPIVKGIMQFLNREHWVFKVHIMYDTCKLAEGFCLLGGGKP